MKHERPHQHPDPIASPYGLQPAISEVDGISQEMPQYRAPMLRKLGAKSKQYASQEGDIQLKVSVP